MIHNPVTRWLSDDSVTPYLYSSRNRSYTLNEKLILTSPWRKERKWGKLYSMKSYWKRVNKAFTPRRGVKGVRWVKNKKYSGASPFRRLTAVTKHPSLDWLYKALLHVVPQVVASQQNVIFWHRRMIERVTEVDITRWLHIPGRKNNLEDENVMNAAAMDTQMGANCMNSPYRKNSWPRSKPAYKSAVI